MNDVNIVAVEVVEGVKLSNLTNDQRRGAYEALLSMTKNGNPVRGIQDSFFTF